MQKEHHKIKEQLVRMRVSVDNIATIPELSSSILDTLEVSGLPPDADAELLKLYFESKRSGSHSDAVEKCSIVVPGTAHVKFKSSEGTQCTILCIYHRSGNVHVKWKKICIVKFLRFLLIRKMFFSYHMYEH